MSGYIIDNTSSLVMSTFSFSFERTIQRSDKTKQQEILSQVHKHKVGEFKMYFERACYM